MRPPSSSTINNSYNRRDISTVERIKEGFNIWRKGWLSFILAEFLLFFALAIFLVPIMAIAHYFGLIYQTSPAFLDPIIVSVLTVFAVAFHSLVLGTMCGLGKELIEIEDTRAENTLHYIKKHGLRFIEIGLIIFAVIFAPMISIMAIVHYFGVREIGIFAFLATFFLIAPFILSIPALVVDDMSFIESVKISIKHFRNDPRTVLLLTGFFTAIFLLILSPTIATRVMVTHIIAIQTVTPRVTPAISAVVAFFGSLFVFFPVMCITFTKLYYDYKIPKKEEVSEEESPISLF